MRVCCSKVPLAGIRDIPPLLGQGCTSCRLPTSAATSKARGHSSCEWRMAERGIFSMQKDLSEKLMTTATEIRQSLMVWKVTAVQCGGERSHARCMQGNKSKMNRKFWPSDMGWLSSFSVWEDQTCPDSLYYSSILNVKCWCCKTRKAHQEYWSGLLMAAFNTALRLQRTGSFSPVTLLKPSASSALRNFKWLGLGSFQSISLTSHW